jgi:hypothetical protein
MAMPVRIRSITNVLLLIDHGTSALGGTGAWNKVFKTGVWLRSVDVN